MIFDAVKRILGYGGNGSRQENERQPSMRFDLSLENQDQSTNIPRDYEQSPPYRSPMPPDISRIESEVAAIHKLMEQQMRSMMGSFGFILDNPFSRFGFDEPINEQSPSIPFQGSHNSHDSISPTLPISPPLNPRDEVLKPEFRSKSPAQWSGQDLVLDERLQEEDLGAIISDLRPPNGLTDEDGSLVDSFSQLFGGGLFGNGIWNGSDSITSSSSVTIHSNVNGHKYFEKIVRHPDGTIERTVISDDKKPEP